MNSKILNMSATAAAVISICPNLVCISPLFFSTGSIIPTDVVTIINEKYQILFISVRFESSIVAKYEKTKAIKKWDIPISNGLLRYVATVNFRLGNEAISWSISISSPLKNIRKTNPDSARNLNIIRFWSSNSMKRCPTKNPRIISMITDGTFLRPKTDNNTGVIHAIAKTISNG